jgi:hypothetical protein
MTATLNHVPEALSVTVSNELSGKNGPVDLYGLDGFFHDVARWRSQRWPRLEQDLAQGIAISVPRPGNVRAAQGIQQGRKLPGSRAPPARPDGIARQGDAAGAALEGRQAPEARLPGITDRGDPEDALVIPYTEENAKSRGTTQLDCLDA